MSTDSAGGSPPRPRLAFRVGAVGHRPNRLLEADIEELRSRLRTALAEVKAAVHEWASVSPDAQLYSEEPPLLRAVSPLAEGADRLFGEEALRLGYQLCCPMPFSQDEFERDFVQPHALEPGSLQRFRGLLDIARNGPGLVTFELDGDRRKPGEAYAAGGRVVLNQCDLLVAVWDGRKAAGTGGTVDTLHTALRFNIPVLWIDAVKPHLWCVVRSEEDLGSPPDGDRFAPRGARTAVANKSTEVVRTQIARIVSEELSLPPIRSGGDDPVTAADYSHERKPKRNPMPVWKLFRTLLGSARLQVPLIKVPDFESAVSGDWPTWRDRPKDDSAQQPKSEPAVPTIESTTEWVNDKLRPHYAWADKLADFYADRYRSTYILIYVCAAIAVFLALLPMAMDWDSPNVPRTGRDLHGWVIALELAILLFIVERLWREHRGHWHLRWLSYRLLAELVRELRVLIPLGGGRPLPRVPPHLAVWGDPAQSWMYWQVRALARAIGIPNAAVTQTYVHACLDNLDQVVRDPRAGQHRFHVMNEKVSERIHVRLHRASLSAFGLTIVAILLHLVTHVSGRTTQEQGAVPKWLHGGVPLGVEGWLTLLCATLPAVGAALASINNQGEFARVGKRSRAMAGSFSQYARRIDQLRAQANAGRAPLTMATVTSLASEIAQLMVDEVADWRVVFLDRAPTAT